MSPTVIAETIEAGTVSFTSPDAATEDVTAPTQVTYCPSNKCPAGWTTCPNSRFPCDVNILRDIDNCGACGNACPTSTSATEGFSCINGACVVECNVRGDALDCDGLPDSGCETMGITNMNCGACGKECPDPAMPCLLRDGLYDCGCAVDEQFCNGTCVARDDDNNCGACGNQCPPNNDGGPAPDNAYYGCSGKQCGALKCKGAELWRLWHCVPRRPGMPRRS